MPPAARISMTCERVSSRVGAGAGHEAEREPSVSGAANELARYGPPDLEALRGVHRFRDGEAVRSEPLPLLQRRVEIDIRQKRLAGERGRVFSGERRELVLHHEMRRRRDVTDGGRLGRAGQFFAVAFEQRIVEHDVASVDRDFDTRHGLLSRDLALIDLSTAASGMLR
jgi:hypothetical protein